jgi:hypothetical protein
VKETFHHSAALQFRKLLGAVPHFDTGTNWSKREQLVTQNISKTLGGREPNEHAPLKLHTTKNGVGPLIIAPSASNRNHLGASKSIKSFKQ